MFQSAEERILGRRRKVVDQARYSKEESRRCGVVSPTSSSATAFGRAGLPSPDDRQNPRGARLRSFTPYRNRWIRDSKEGWLHNTIDVWAVQTKCSSSLKSILQFVHSLTTPYPSHPVLVHVFSQPIEGPPVLGQRERTLSGRSIAHCSLKGTAQRRVCDFAKRIVLGLARARCPLWRRG